LRRDFLEQRHPEPFGLEAPRTVERTFEPHVLLERGDLEAAKPNGGAVDVLERPAGIGCDDGDGRVEHDRSALAGAQLRDGDAGGAGLAQ
jgi:hypothetical protein